MESPDHAARRLSAIVESSDDAIVSKDLKGTILTWNRAAERIFGYTAAEAVGKSITIIIPTDRLGEETEVISRISRGLSVEHYETVRRRKDGTLIPISLTISPLRNAEGVVVGASKIARDISDRRRAEHAVAEVLEQKTDLQNRLMALVTASSTLFGSPNVDDVMLAALGLAQRLMPADGYALWRLDPVTRAWKVGGSAGVSLDFANRIIANYSSGTSPTVPFSDPLVVQDVATHPMLGDRKAAYESEGIQSLLAVPLQIAGEASGTLVLYYRKSHQFDDVEVQTARALGSLTSAAITTADLNDNQRRMRERAEQMTRQAEFLSHASATLAGSLDYESTLSRVANLAVPHVADWCAIDIVDENGDIKRVAVAHVDPAKVELARTLQERYPEAPDSTSGIRAAIRTGQPTMLSEIPEGMIERAARNPEHLAALKALQITSYISVPLVAHGRTLGVLTFVSAESKRRYTEEDLKFAQDVAYRSAIAIDNSRAYARANAANRAKDEFLAMLSHELRTPLNAVLGWVRMLRSGAVAQAKVPRALEVIEHNADAQLRLVEDLLDLSRIITGKFRLDLRPVHVSTPIDAAVSAVLPAATAKGITLEVDPDSDVGAVQGDVQRLQQAIWNLLSNATKFTPAGGHIKVAVKSEGPDVVIDVSDTGEGIPASVLPYVFDRFRQGDSGTTRAHMGLGLGLAIVRHIIEMQGGKVEVKSGGKGRGSTFTITLPALQSSKDQSGSRRLAAARSTSVPPQLTRAVAGVRVLVVDDDADTLELLDELLNQAGLTVRTASSVDQALAAVDGDVPDVIISDIAMAGQDGYDLVRRLRERPPSAGSAVPVVALSAFARDEDAERSITSGFSAHLAKPADLPVLLGAIAEATGRTAGA